MSELEKLTKKPTPSEVMRLKLYWDRMGELPYPGWAFDFISVHGNSCQGYTLISPLCLIEQADGLYGPRPEFEKETFTRKWDAIKRATEIAKEHKVFVLDASN
jgi:hypothetical protein